MKHILGVDCGDTIFHYLTGKPVAGAIEGLRAIAQSGRFGEIYLVSKIDRFSKYFYLFSLWRLDFWRRTGIPRRNIRFCRRHREKAPLCKELGVTHFIDDRLEVLDALESVPHRFAFNPPIKEIVRYTHVLDYVFIASSWAMLLPILLNRS